LNILPIKVSYTLETATFSEYEVHMNSDNAGTKMENIGRMLHRAHGYISRLRHTQLRILGLTPIRVGVLTAVMESPEPVTIAIIAAKIARQLHTITELLDRMQKDGLISKIRRKDISALYAIEATDKGRQAYYQAKHIDVDKRIISTLSPQEQENLVVYLEKLISRSLTEIRKQIGTPDE